MNTLKEKIKILEAMEKGSTIQYSETDGETDEWEDLKTSELDFDLYTYRVKPNSKPRTNPDARFKVGDVLVLTTAAETINPIRYEVTEVTNNSYKFDCMIPCLIEEANENFINERDVLWCVGIYDYTSKKYSMHPTRMTIPEMDKEFGANHDTLSWKPIYPFGFKLKEN